MRKHLFPALLVACISTLLLNAQSRITIGSNYVSRVSMLALTSTYYHQGWSINGISGIDSIPSSKKQKEFHVTGDAQISGNVGIGTTSFPYRLNVLNKSTAIYANSTGGHGVLGLSEADGFAGVYGINFNSNGYGVWGSSTNIGVFGNGNTGVYGTGSNYGLWGNSDHIGVYGNSSNTNGYGIYGASPFRGVFGTGAFGLMGVANTDTGTGVWGSGGTNGVYGISTNSGSYGVYGTSPNIAIKAVASDTGTGVWATGGAYGVYGTGFFGIYGAGSIGSYGLSGEDNGIGVEGNSTGYLGYGGYFASSQGNGINAVTFSPDIAFAGFFDGDVYTTGLYFSSDRRLKQNINEVDNAMDIINKLQPKYYEYRQDGNFKLMNLPRGKHFGLVAQDVEQVLPDLVKETVFDTRVTQRFQTQGQANNKSAPATAAEKINYKSLNYTELIPIMIKAMQELSKKDNEIDALKQKNNDLEERLAKLEEIVLNKNNITTGLSGASLEQNTPNPFNSATVIRYNLPQNAASAKVVITDMSGKTIKSISLTNRGNGQLTLNSGTLTAGSYNYTLWMDGKQIDSKKMVITK